MKTIVRLAESADISKLEALIAASARALQASDYSERQIEGAIGSVFGLDSRLIADRTYFAAVKDECIVGCGGWSARRTLFGGDAWQARDDERLDPRTHAAKIRALFVHPGAARTGVGTLLLDACESAARAAGFTRFELGATLTGRRLFAAGGYSAVELVDVALSNGATMPIVRMAKG